MGTRGGPVWDSARMAYSALQRRQIMDCIQRLNAREAKVLGRVVMHLTGSNLRQEISAWYRLRWSYLLGEYEKVLPHVTELPVETADYMVRNQMAEEAAGKA